MTSAKIRNVGIVDMVMLTGDKLADLDRLSSASGVPLGQRKAWGGALYSCGSSWSALVSDRQVKEVWVARR